MRNLFLMLCLLLQSSVSAQEIIRAAALSGFDDPSQYNFVSGTTYNLTVTLVNDSDDDDFQEDLSVLYLTDKMIQDATPPEVLVPEAILSIPALGTLDVPVNNFPINPNNFRVGGNIVVIWPSYSAPAIDSLVSTINVADTLITSTQHQLENLAQSQFSMKKIDAAPFIQMGVKKLWLVSSSGATVATFNHDTTLDLAHLNTGFYMLCFIDQKGRLFVVKQFHQP